MLDELLGRAELKARIEELEEKNHHLERQLEAEQGRRAEAVADKQDAEERVNQLEDRITELEDRVERATGEETTRDFRRVSDARGARTRDLLGWLTAIETGDEGALTATIPNGDSVPEAVADHFGENVPLVRRAAPAIVLADDSGIVSAALRPPIEPEEASARWDDAFDLPLDQFLPTGRLGFALVRSDVFAVGVYADVSSDDDAAAIERVSFEGFESDVKGAHSKGGFSQARFERRRDEQIAEHVDAVQETLAPIAENVDRLVVVGERTVLGEVRDLADVTDVSDSTGAPEAALADAFDDFWTTRVYAL
ncbi:Vms1/Ankzf1 family peptidyl-tRNA hydrolase [Halopenitus sp. H-Gu1]|uniref:Vms1/Ankzf1 family peptidyl-tRNA hydrolase n=1 Tax=Halopenitus sp. H-Gu1 TaxID=3242697 RepID=UPI00359DF1C0